MLTGKAAESSHIKSENETKMDVMKTGFNDVMWTEMVLSSMSKFSIICV
jgi:hypothetical protein